ncbi:hypothetical protein D9M71_183980 [compost metagenome]
MRSSRTFEGINKAPYSATLTRSRVSDSLFAGRRRTVFASTLTLSAARQPSGVASSRTPRILRMRTSL